jgi:hypothetical protein
VVDFEKVATQLTDADANLKAWAVALFLKKLTGTCMLRIY